MIPVTTRFVVARVLDAPDHPASWTYPYQRSGSHLVRYIAEDFAVPYFPLFLYADMIRTTGIEGRSILPWQEEEVMRVFQARSGQMRGIFYATAAALMRTGWEPKKDFNSEATIEGAKESGYA